MVRLLLCFPIVVLLSGCFVFDEIEQGNAFLDAHSPRGSKQQEMKLAEEAEKEAADAKAASSDKPFSWAGVKETVDEWWQEALEEEPLERDPSDGVVRCEIRGSVQFLRKSDCSLRGGRVFELSSSQK